MNIVIFIITLICSTITFIVVADNNNNNNIPNGRCDRQWLPYMKLKSSSSQQQQQPVIDLKELASNTNTKARLDFVQTTLSANLHNKEIIQRLNVEKIKVQSTFDNIAIAIKLEKKCSHLISSKNVNWNGKISTSKTRKAKPGSKLPKSCSLVFTPKRNFIGETLILYNKTTDDQIYSVIVQVLPCKNEPRTNDDYIRNKLYGGVSKRLNVLENDGILGDSNACIEKEIRNVGANTQENPKKVYFTDIANEIGIRANQSKIRTSPNCIFPSFDINLNRWDKGTFCVQEALTGGACVGDIDGDRIDDIYYPRMDGADKLYRNRVYDGTFEDVSKTSGIHSMTKKTRGNGCQFVDIDNDGDNDIYVSTLGDSQFYLYVNDGTGKFVEESLQRGLANVKSGAAAGKLTAGFTIAIGDYNLDGAIDILTTEWLPWLDREGMDHKDAMNVRLEEATNSRLYMNNASNPGYFTDVTFDAGIRPGLRAPRDKFISSTCTPGTKLELLETIQALGDVGSGTDALTEDSDIEAIRDQFRQTLASLLSIQPTRYTFPHTPNLKDANGYKYVQIPRVHFVKSNSFEIRIEVIRGMGPVKFVISGKEERKPVYKYKHALAKGKVESEQVETIKMNIDMNDPYGVRTLFIGLACLNKNNEGETSTDCGVEITIVSNNKARRKLIQDLSLHCNPHLAAEEHVGMFTVPIVAPWVRSETFISHATNRMVKLNYSPTDIRQKLKQLFAISRSIDQRRRTRVRKTEKRITDEMAKLPPTIEKYEMMGKFQSMNTGAGLGNAVKSSSNGGKKQMIHIAQFPMVGSFQFGAKMSDLDNDGYPDIIISGDFGTSQMYWNNGDGTFTKGTFDFIEDILDNSMGATVGDWNMDGKMDIMFTSVSIADKDLKTLNSVAATAGMMLNFRGNHLYKNTGARKFEDVTEYTGVRESGWGWGAMFFDADNDGDLDILNGNGMDDPETTDDDWAVNQKMRLYINEGSDGSFKMNEAAEVHGIANQMENRGAMSWDFDNDGDLDVLVINHGAPPSLYRNDGGNYYDYIRVKVYEENGRESIGARVFLDLSEDSEVGEKGTTLVREISNKAAFLGQGESVAHFGLGKFGEKYVYRVRILWPKSKEHPEEETAYYYNVPIRTTLVVKRESIEFTESKLVVANAAAVLPMCKNRQIISITSPSHGDATISESKLHVEYRPISNFYGEDAFTYKMTDGLGGTSEATVRLFVTKMNETILQQIAIDSNDKPNSKMSDSSCKNSGDGSSSSSSSESSVCTTSKKNFNPFTSINSRYRSFSGNGYNLDQPSFDASAFTMLRRYSKPAYSDGYEEPAGLERPSARQISNVLFTQTKQIFDENGLNDLSVHMGQFIAHDMSFVTPLADFTAQGNFAIHIPKGDVTFDPKSTGVATMRFRRSGGKEGTGKVSQTPRQQVNKVSGWLDMSVVYGASVDRSNAMRTKTRGALRSNYLNEEEQLTFNTKGLPNLNLLGRERESLVVSGDNRVNVQPGLLSFHTIWAREHNKVAKEIAMKYPTMDDERIFQHARRSTIATYQSTLMYEWLPLVIGKKMFDEKIGPYTTYDPTVDPRISNEFATVAFRFGHSQASDFLARLDENLEELKHGHLHLKNTYFTPQRVLNEGGIDPIVRGMIRKRCQAIDTIAADGLRNHLFGTSTSGFDLVSLNIQRGRDHGITDYNSLREAYGLKRFERFEEISNDLEIVEKLKTLYKNNISNIDAFVGGLAEDHMKGASIGELFGLIVADQFKRSRDGDVHWFENTEMIAEKNDEDDDGDDVLFNISYYQNMRMVDVLRRNTNMGVDLELVGGSNSAYYVGNVGGACPKYVEICKHKEGEIVQKTLRDEVLERYQRAVDYFNERADSAENIIEEAKKRGISGEKLLKHIDEKYPYSKPEVE